MILTRFPGRRFILARGLLHNRGLPGFQPPGRHLLLRLETPKAAHLLPMYVSNLGSLILSALAVGKPLPSLYNAQTNLQTSLCGQWEHGWEFLCHILLLLLLLLLPPCAKDLAYRLSIRVGALCAVNVFSVGKCGQMG